MNPTLYAALQARFGDVKVMNEGQPADWVQTFKGGRLDVRPTGGEHYRVCCPRCHDTRFRMTISYLWGTADSNGQPQNYLVHCFNEECQSAAVPLRLQEELQAYIDTGNVSVPTTIGDVGRYAAKPIQWPGRCVPITELPDDHPANQFFIGRGYDPAMVVEIIGACACVEPAADVPSWLARALPNYAILPIYNGQELVGWQGRFVGQSFGIKVAKYITAPGFRKSAYVYRSDFMEAFAAAGAPLGIVAESILDCLWLPCAGAVLGGSVSPRQLDRLAAIHGSGALVIAFDSDAIGKATKIAERAFSSFRGGVWPFALPDERRPEFRLTTDQLMRSIVESIRMKGARL